MTTDTEQSVEVVVSDDKLHVAVSCTYSEEAADELRTKIREQLTSLGIEKKWEELDIAALLAAAAAENPEIDSLIIYEGTPSVPPVDGYVEWGGDFFTEGFVTDEKTGAMDFRRAAAQVSVAEGDLLATIIPPVEGTLGRDVLGTTLKVLKAQKVALRAGQGCEQREDGLFYATKSGRVRRDEKAVWVDDVYTIRGDVGLKSGHVNHPGAVVIEGDITEGSEVDAAGDVEVHGIIEFANVRCGGDLTVHGGIIGSEDTSIQVGGNLLVHYILEATMEVSGNVTVEREIMNSTLTCRGTLLAPTARIVGGEICAPLEIQAGNIGSEASVKTSMILGEDPLRDRKLRKQRVELEDVLEVLDKIAAALLPHRGSEDSLPPDRKEVFEILKGKMSEAEEKKGDLKDSIKTLEDESVSRGEMTMLVLEQAYPETVFTLRKESHILRHNVSGPVKVTFRKGKIKFVAQH